MGRLGYFVVVLCVLMLAISCSEGEPTGLTSAVGARGETTSARGFVEDSMPEATVGAAPDTSDTSLTTRAGPGFGRAVNASGGRGFAADGLLAVRHGVHEGYERVVLDLGSGQSPAGSVSEWSLFTRKGDGLLRVRLPSVVSTSVSDGLIEDDSLRGFHVVRSPDGGLFVDILSDETFVYRTMELRDPARLVIDFKSSGEEPRLPLPESGGETVLTSPRAEETISNPLTVSGYSRNFEGRNSILLLDDSGDVISRGSVESNDWSSTWGYFEATLEVPEFTGPGTLRVGEQSARDGEFEGVEVPVVGAG